MSMYICTFIYIYVFIHMYIYIYIYLRIYMYIYIHTHSLHLTEWFATLLWRCTFTLHCNTLQHTETRYALQPAGAKHIEHVT